MTPYAGGELIRLLAAACAEPPPEAQVFARPIGCVLAGAELPARDDDPIEVHVDVGVIEVDGSRWVAPTGMVLPHGGLLNRADVEAARGWARVRLKVSTDLRRLNLTALTMPAGSAPALTMLSKPGVGRDRLTAAAGAACRPDANTVRSVLRGC